MSRTAKGDSPCIDVCTLDPSTGYCVGCFRNIDEIAGWAGFTEEQRAAILVGLPGRRTRFLDSVSAAAGRSSSSAASCCVRCGATFRCGAGDPSRACWCTTYPPIAPSQDASAGCLCPRCLASAATGRQE